MMNVSTRLGKSSWKAVERASAEARWPPPVSEMRKRMRRRGEVDREREGEGEGRRVVEGRREFEGEEVGGGGEENGGLAEGLLREKGRRGRRARSRRVVWIKYEGRRLVGCWCKEVERRRGGGGA